MSSNSLLKSKSLDFVVRVINLNKHLKKKHGESTISRQIIRADTSIGDESRDWLQPVYATEFMTKKKFDSTTKGATELLKMLISGVETIKSRSAKV